MAKHCDVLMAVTNNSFDHGENADNGRDQNHDGGMFTARLITYDNCRRAPTFSYDDYDGADDEEYNDCHEAGQSMKATRMHVPILYL